MSPMNNRHLRVKNLWPVAAAENKSAFEIGSRRVGGRAFACGPMNLSPLLKIILHQRRGEMEMNVQ